MINSLVDGGVCNFDWLYILIAFIGQDVNALITFLSHICLLVF